MLQRNLNLVEYTSLKGAARSSQKPPITLQSWLSGDYQKKAANYCTDSFGFRTPLVRAINQLDLNLFNRANAQYVIVGKNNCLYETPYIEAHLGMDFLGDSLVLAYSKKMQMLHDTLEALGVDLQMVFAPGKASYFPEYIPDYYKKYQTSNTNYQRFKHYFDSLQFSYIDLHTWVRSMKDTSSYPLFPLTGIHWSKYGMVLATDSLLKYWYNNSSNAPCLNWEKGIVTTETQGSDADVEDGMNLMYPLNRFPMMYPKYDWVTDSSNRLKTAVIADSYYWGLFDIGLSSSGSEGEFWYYFKQVYPQYFEDGLMVDDLDLKAAIESKDVIVLLQTDATLDRFGFGFVEAAFDLYF
ncbi:MAG: hypothetical protein JJ975_07295 [Bacteroidia bacterium]|nr:hypothetical protein [Bacteroidia bacterium]